MKQNRFSLFHSFGFLTVGTVLGKATGFLKHYLIVYFFSISQYSDAFFIANMIPELMVNILISGLLAGALIPVGGEILTIEGEKTFESFIGSIIMIVGGVCAVFSLLLLFFPEYIAILLAPDYGYEQRLIVVQLLRYFSPGMFFLGLAAILSGVLQILEDFRIVSFGLFIYNIIFFFTLLLFKNKLNVYAAGLGISIGAFFWFFSHLVFTLKYIKINISVKIISNYLQKTAKLAIPSLLIIFISNLVLIIEKNLASVFESGTISELNLAFRLTNLFLVILILPLSTVLLPRLSKYFSAKKYEKISETIQQVMKIITIGLVLVLILIVFNITLITKGIYYFLNIQSQNFLSISKYALLYALSFIGLFYYMFLMRVYFSMQKVWEIVKANLLGFVSYLIIYFLLKDRLASSVFPMAYAIYAIVTTLYLVVYLSTNLFKTKTFFYWQKSFYIFNGIYLIFIFLFKVSFNYYDLKWNLFLTSIFLIFYIIILMKLKMFKIKI